MLPSVAIWDTAADRGARRGKWLRTRTAVELDDARRATGLSLRELARRLGVSHARIARALRGDPAVLTIDFAAQLAAVLGLELGVTLHPDADPVRDKGHIALLGRLRARIDPSLRWRVEVPIPLTGDRRSIDAVITGNGFAILVEAETHLVDVQALERTIAGKQRDAGIPRAVLLLSDTRHHRSVLERIPGLRERFPIGTRACLAALGRGRDPGGDGLIVM